MEQQQHKEHNTRHRLAMGIVLFSAGAVTLLGALSIWNDKERAPDIMSQILPLLGTWVGAVIAFYFAKDNLESATRATKEMLTLDSRLKSVKAVEAMIPVSSIDGLRRVAKAKDIDDMKVSEVLAEMGHNRLPVVDEHNASVLVIHRSTLTEFLADRALQGESVKELTFKDFMKARPKLFSKLKAFAFIGTGDTLAEAKRAMEQHSADCADVFVTSSGQATDPTLGWITNAEIGKRSQA